MAPLTVELNFLLQRLAPELITGYRIQQASNPFVHSFPNQNK